MVFGLSSGPERLRRSSGLLRPTLFIVPINDPLTVRAILQAVDPLQLIVHLGRDVDVAPAAHRVADADNGQPVGLLGLHPPVERQCLRGGLFREAGRLGLHPLKSGLGLTRFLKHAVLFGSNPHGLRRQALGILEAAYLILKKKKSQRRLIGVDGKQKFLTTPEIYNMYLEKFNTMKKELTNLNK